MGANAVGRRRAGTLPPASANNREVAPPNADLAVGDVAWPDVHAQRHVAAHEPERLVPQQRAGQQALFEKVLWTVDVPQHRFEQAAALRVHAPRQLAARRQEHRVLERQRHAIGETLEERGPLPAGVSLVSGNGINGFVVNATVTSAVTWDGDDGLPFVVDGLGVSPGAPRRQAWRAVCRSSAGRPRDLPAPHPTALDRHSRGKQRKADIQ